MTKTSRDENFPVGSWLLPEEMRVPVQSFYAFVRAADDIADAPDLKAEEKKARLAALREETVLLGSGEAPAQVLLSAFEQDVRKNRYSTFAEVMAYCRMSAAPVGRYLISLVGGGVNAHPASDALCAALQLLNHVQDCGDDYRWLNRIYLPGDWIYKAGADERDLAAPSSSPAIRRVLDRMLDEIDRLLGKAAPIGAIIAHPKLAREAAGIHALAVRLSKVLRHRDPLAERVELGKVSAAWTFLWGAWRAGDPKGQGARASSFYGAMRLLPQDRREGIFALYDFCRAVDDIADGEADPATKQANLNAWREDVDAVYAGKTPRLAEVRRLADVIASYDLDKQDVVGLLDGMAMDAAGAVRMADEAALFLYCDQVAGTVGRMSARIFGAPPSASADAARQLGAALQLTNILRDVAEDSLHDRLYIPGTILARHGVPGDDADTARLHPNFGAALAEVAEEARHRFAAADTALASCGESMRPARVMGQVYRRVLAMLARTGWDRPGALGHPRLGRAAKAWIAVRYGVWG